MITPTSPVVGAALVGGEAPEPRRRDRITARFLIAGKHAARFGRPKKIAPMTRRAVPKRASLSTRNSPPSCHGSRVLLPHQPLNHLDVLLQLREADLHGREHVARFLGRCAVTIGRQLLNQPLLHGNTPPRLRDVLASQLQCQ
jgi:hypothetical protein